MADPKRGDANSIKVNDERIPSVARRPTAVPRPGEARALSPNRGRKRKRRGSELNWPFAALVTVAVWGLIALLVFRSQSPNRTDRVSSGLITTTVASSTTAAPTTTTTVAPSTTAVTPSTTAVPSTAATTAVAPATTAVPPATTAAPPATTAAPPATTVAPTTTTRVVIAGYSTSASVAVDIPEALGDNADVNGLTGTTRVFASQPATLNASTNAGCVVSGLPGTVVQGQKITVDVDVFYKENVAGIGSEACGFSISLTAPNCAADCTFTTSRISVRINP